MNEDRLLFGIAIIAVAVSLLAAGLTYFSISDLVSRISGRVSTGEANLTVETRAEINFTTRAMSWGSGRVNQDVTAASLTTSNFTGIANVTGGNWTFDSNPSAAAAQASGLIIENIGNVNVTINFTVGKTAATFIGGTNPAYEWNLSTMGQASCLNSTQQNLSNDRMNKLLTATSAITGNLWCDVFPYESTKDNLRIDFNLTIPENSLTGALGDVITATVTAL